jgi:hypothetical protein
MGAITQSESQVIQQLKKSRGNVSHAANKLDTSRETLHKYINEYPTVKDALHDIRESAKDRGEEMLQSRMAHSDTLLIFFLKTQAHDRGYGDRSQHEHSGGTTMRVVYGDDGTNDTTT